MMSLRCQFTRSLHEIAGDAVELVDAPFRQAITGVAERVVAAYFIFDYLKEISIEYKL